MSSPYRPCPNPNPNSNPYPNLVTSCGQCIEWKYSPVYDMGDQRKMSEVLLSAAETPMSAWLNYESSVRASKSPSSDTASGKASVLEVYSVYGHPCNNCTCDIDPLAAMVAALCAAFSVNRPSTRFTSSHCSSPWRTPLPPPAMHLQTEHDQYER